MEEIYHNIRINPQVGITLAQQVKDQIDWMIVSGVLKPGDRLPSIRKLAAHLDINLHTVRNAYAKLDSDGLVATRHGPNGTTIGSRSSGR